MHTTTKPVSRRHALKTGALGTMALAALASAGGMLQFAWPRNVKGFGGTFTVPAENIPAPGADPVPFLPAQALLVNLAPSDTSPGGILALWRKCPHLGCSVPWQPTFDFNGTKGWFRCPCHQSTYTRAGVRVWGPAPRSMDTLAVSFDEKGRLVINTGKITAGGDDNPSRAVRVPG